ncbi:MAG: 3-oxoacyl-ACP synthase III family protein [Cytophagaceae bacterium]
MKTSKVAGVGHYVPETIVRNQDLTSYMDTSDEWIVERTGIKERRFFKEGLDTVSNMGAKASLIALQRANIDVMDVDMIVFATLSPDYNFPGSGVLMQRELGLKNIPALDIRMQCGGFIYALSIADQFIKTGNHKTILVVGSEIQSNVMELSNRGRNMAVIFGDGAGAVVLQASDEGRGILSTHLHSDGSHAEELMLAHPGSNKKQRITAEMIADGSFLPHMNGQLVFKNAVQRFPEVIQEALDANKLSVKDIDLLIPHQANLRISEYVQQKMELSPDKVYNNIQKYGNTTAASIPIAMSEAWEEGRIRENDLLCLAAFGSGFVWASALIKW